MGCKIDWHWKYDGWVVLCSNAVQSLKIPKLKHKVFKNWLTHLEKAFFFYNTLWCQEPFTLDGFFINEIPVLAESYWNSCKIIFVWKLILGQWVVGKWLLNSFLHWCWSKFVSNATEKIKLFENGHRLSKNMTFVRFYTNKLQAINDKDLSNKYYKECIHTFSTQTSCTAD